MIFFNCALIMIAFEQRQVPQSGQASKSMVSSPGILI